jgi:hypothetical protein
VELVSSQYLIYINIIIKSLLKVLINHPVIMGVINSSQSRTFPLHHCQSLPGPVPWLLSMVISLRWMSDIARQTTTSMFFRSLAFFLMPMRYKEQSTSSLGKQLSLLVSIDCCHPPPLPFPIKNGATFLLVAWSSNHRTLLVQKLVNMLVVYSDQQLMTSI